MLFQLEAAGTPWGEDEKDILRWVRARPWGCRGSVSLCGIFHVDRVRGVALGKGIWLPEGQAMAFLSVWVPRKQFGEAQITFIHK